MNLPRLAHVVDINELVTTIEDVIGNGSPLLYLGGTVLLVQVLVVAFKWVRRVLN